MKKLLFLLFLVNLSSTIQGQVIRIDTAKIVNIDKKIKVYSKQDSLKKFYKIIPRTATIRSAMVPGWGQVYNRQYWKLPLVAGAFAVNIYFIARNDVRYHYYRNILGDTYAGGTANTTSTFKVPIYDDPANIREYNQDQLNNIVAGYRKNRDGSYLILLAVWAANIVDANVTAHLKTFDMTDDISLKIQPTFSSPDIMEPVFGAKLILTMK
ncbi:MAG: hypothetical protein H7339_15290 [Arcicella sp.]|nr:hypothetical protein [Arcicella sp.]